MVPVTCDRGLVGLGLVERWPLEAEQNIRDVEESVTRHLHRREHVDNRRVLSCMLC
jgi:hypothetical protein